MGNQDLETSSLTIASHVRAPLVFDPIDSKIETLRSCEHDGRIGTHVIRSWPNEISMTEETEHREVIDRFAEFDEWADAHDVSIQPPFRVRTTTSLETNETIEILVTPVMCLALYLGSQLVGVYPHSTDRRTITASDAVEALQAGTFPSGVSVPREVADSIGHTEDRQRRRTDVMEDGGYIIGTDSCPICGDTLVTLNGFQTCSTCSWSDSELSTIESPEAKLVYLSLSTEPVSIDTLRRTLGLNKMSLLGILGSLSERGLVERLDAENYRLPGNDDLDRESPTDVMPTT